MTTRITINRPDSSTINIEVDTTLSIIELLREIFHILSMENGLTVGEDKMIVPRERVASRENISEFEQIAKSVETVPYVETPGKKVLAERSFRVNCVRCNTEFIASHNRTKTCSKCAGDKSARQKIYQANYLAKKAAKEAIDGFPLTKAKKAAESPQKEQVRQEKPTERSTTRAVRVNDDDGYDPENNYKEIAYDKHGAMIVDPIANQMKIK